MSSRLGSLACLVLTSILLSSLAFAEEPQLVATLHFEVGNGELDAEHRATLDGIKAQYPPADYIYSFEGDHDPSPFDIITEGASKRVNERLGETRWQAAALYLGVPAIGLVRYTGKTESRVYVLRRSDQGAVVRGPGQGGVEDSLAAMRRELDGLRRWREDEEALRRRTAPAETILSVARIEELHERSDKWVDRAWWEAAGGLEIGILRVSPERPEKRTGATLAMSNGTPSYHALDISLRLDLFRLGKPRIGITPALRWYDWGVRVHYGPDDAHAPISYINDSDPVFLFGADLDAVPWKGSLLRLGYAGFGARVHASHRNVISYDQYNLRIDQNIYPRLRLELQAIYDERFDISMCYYGAWIAYGWRMLMGEFAVHLGYVEQLAALEADREDIEDPIGTISIGLSWERQRRFRY